MDDTSAGSRPYRRCVRRIAVSRRNGPITCAAYAGTPLKGIALTFEDETLRGEMMIAEYGLEGGAIYALSSPLREAIARDGDAILHIDLRPDLSAEALTARLESASARQTLSNVLRKAAGLTPAAIALLREASHPLPDDLEALVALIKSVPVTLLHPRPLARAISSLPADSTSQASTRL